MTITYIHKHAGLTCFKHHNRRGCSGICGESEFLKQKFFFFFLLDVTQGEKFLIWIHLLSSYSQVTWELTEEIWKEKRTEFLVLLIFF